MDQYGARRTSRNSVFKPWPSTFIAVPEKGAQSRSRDDNNFGHVNMTYKSQEDLDHSISRFKEIPLEDSASGSELYSSSAKCFGKLREYFLVSSNERVYSRIKQAHRSVNEERARHLDSYPYIIHPYSSFRWYWDIFMTIVLTLTLIGQPLQIAFYPKSMKQLDSAIVGSIVSIIFSIDIFLNFRTGFVQHESDDIILQQREVALKYLKTWFAVDLVSTIPFDAIYVAINDAEGHGQLYFKYFRLLELLKVLRLARVIRYLGRIERAYEIKNIYSRVINLLVMMFFLIHWLGCMHYLVADMANSYPYPRKEWSWLSQMELWDRPVWEKYAHCILRALSNMACLGYGFVTPRAPEDVICTLVCIMIGATCFALFIANISNIVLNLDASQKKYLESLNQTIDYMNFKHVPKSIQHKVISYYEQRYRRNLFNEEEIMSNISNVLRQKLQMFNCKNLVEQVPLFQGISEELLHGIVEQLKFELYLASDVIISENTIGTCMYFIDHGIVQVIDKDRKILNQLSDGNFFGEMALLTNERRVASVVAITPCEVYRLEKADFEKVILQYPEISGNILKVAQERQRLKNYMENSNSNETLKNAIYDNAQRRVSVKELDFSGTMSEP